MNQTGAVTHTGGAADRVSVAAAITDVLGGERRLKCPKTRRVVRDEYAEFHDSGVGRVVREVGVDRGLAGFFDVRRRVEIGFPDLEMDDIAALRLQLARATEHGERRFAAQPRDGAAEIVVFVRESSHGARSIRQKAEKGPRMLYWPMGAILTPK